MKSILLHVHEDHGQEARFQVACDLARSLSGHLTCIQVTPLTAYVTADPFGGFYPIAGLYEKLNERNALARAELEKRLANEDARWDWQDCDGDVASTLVSLSRLCDLVVVSQAHHERKDGTQPLPLAADVAIHARAPVLAVPNSATGFDESGAALVAWNGSPEAANALRSAVPLLKTAGIVHIVTVAEEGNSASATEAISYLDHHSIKAQMHQRASDGMTVGKVLDLAAVSLGAGYVVMGA